MEPWVFNEFNPGLFLSWNDAIAPSVDLTLGIYLNSYSRISTSITGHWHPIKGDQWSIGLFAGVAHYPIDGRRMTVHLGGDLLPILGIEIIAGNSFFQLIPQGSGASVISAGTTWKISK